MDLGLSAPLRKEAQNEHDTHLRLLNPQPNPVAIALKPNPLLEEKMMPDEHIVFCIHSYLQ